ncbi:HAD family hydrolase [Salinibaculum rarum]|uniref:HAD family hydrolase n=1 Tax=Salinibaculum rarum TaxID=3058903 RepID=UPI00265ED1A8|nr:HAD family hydrolase [Salinibaculum sp. KK48]
MSLAAVVFDLDYTLAVPDRDRQTLLDEATAAAGGRDIDRSEYLTEHQKNRATETRTPIFEGLLSTGDPAEAARAYREGINDALVPVDGVPELVEELRTQYRVGLLTDGPVQAQQGKLETLGWTDLFDSVVVTGSLAAGKPDGRAFEAVLGELGVAAGAAVYVGDNPDADIRGAKDAGMVAVQVLGDRFERAPEADGYIDRDQLADDLRAFLSQQAGWR